MNFSELPYLAESIEWVRANLYWIVLALVVHFSTLGAVAYLILLERKVASWAQDRIGPNRVGWYGLLQPIADGLKFITKEDYKPDKVDTVLYTIAPALMVIVVVVSVAVIPWGGIKGQRVTVDVTNALAAGVAPVEAVNARLPRSHRVIGDVEFFVLPAVERRVVLPEFRRRDRTANFDEPTLALLADRAVYSPAGNPRPAPLASNQPRRAPLVGPGAVPVDFARDVVYARYTSGFNFIIADLNIGVLFVLSVLSLAVYGVVVGGWASNNKYSFLGGLRACANMISYEIPLGLSVLAVVIMYGTLDLGGIVERQAGYWLYVVPAWNVFTQPLAFMLFLIGIHAEANRAPFDMAEAEQELVGGYHTEYSSMRFALFFLAEYLGMITTSLVCVALFFGGWHLPWVEWLWSGTAVDPQNSAVTNSWVVILIRCGVFFGKAVGVLFFFMWVRWSLPRFRFDQLMQIAWRGLIPISLALVAGTTLGVYFTRGVTYSEMPFLTAMVFLGINVAVLAASMLVYKLVPKNATVNRRIAVPESRYRDTPLPGKPVHRPQKAVLPADPGVQLGGAQGGFAAG